MPNKVLLAERRLTVGPRQRRPAVRTKRAIDVAVSAAALAAASPVFVASALAILLEDGRPVLYRQERLGRDGSIFTAYKFRSMRRNDIPPGRLGEIYAGNPYVTRVGKVLCRLKIDELPQLIQIVKGDMSLVGPRPTLPEQLNGYSPWERRRLGVPPGLTGWAQVNGNVQLSWPNELHWTSGMSTTGACGST